MIDKVHNEKNIISPGCSACEARCGNTDDYDMNEIWNADADIRSLKITYPFGVRGMAAYGLPRNGVRAIQMIQLMKSFYKAPFSYISFDLDESQLLPVVMEVGELI